MSGTYELSNFHKDEVKIARIERAEKTPKKFRAAVCVDCWHLVAVTCGQISFSFCKTVVRHVRAFQRAQVY